MPINPLDGFEIGQREGNAKRSTFSRTASNLMDNFNKQNEMQMKMREGLGMVNYKEGLERNRPVSKKDEAETDVARSRKVLLDEQAKNEAKGITRGRGRLSPQDLADRAQMMGMAPDKAGRLESSLEGIRASRHMKELLFPDGTPESFERQTAFKKNIFGGPVILDESSRDLYRRAGQAIAGKLLVQSGVQTRESEYERLGKQHVANAFSNPKEAKKALDELETFYQGFVGDVDPQGLFYKPEEMEWNYTSTANPLQRASMGGNNSLKQEYASALAKYPGKAKSILADYKQNTGEDYGS